MALAARGFAPHAAYNRPIPVSIPVDIGNAPHRESERGTPPRPVVAHFRDIYLNLSETFIFNYLQHISAFEPIVLARRVRNLELFPITQVFAPPQYTQSRIWRSWQEAWRLMVTQAGVVPRGFDIGRHYFQRVVAECGAALLHAHFGQEGVRLLPLREALALPLVTSFYGYDMSRLPRRFPGLWRRHFRRLFEIGDLFLVEGPHMRSKMIGLGCPPDKVQIQRIAVDMERLRYRPSVKTSEKTILFFCGRFTEKKGLVYLLDAMSRVVGKYPELELRIVGGGPLQGKLQRFAAEKKLTKHIVWLGYQPYPVFAEELRRAHIFAHPSVETASGDSEGGAPTVLIEAQAIGLPVLSTFHADIPEVVRDGEGGFLVPERDVAALCERLDFLAGHPQGWPAMGAAGRAHVEANYNIRIEARALEEKYRRLLAC